MRLQHNRGHSYVLECWITPLLTIQFLLWSSFFVTACTAGAGAGTLRPAATKRLAWTSNRYKDESASVACKTGCKSCQPLNSLSQWKIRHNWSILNILYWKSAEDWIKQHKKHKSTCTKHICQFYIACKILGKCDQQLTMTIQIKLLLRLEALLTAERIQILTFQAVWCWFSYG